MSYNERLTIGLSQGNPGAVVSIVDIIQTYKDVDPESMLGGIGALMMLEEWNIRGSSIYVLFKHKCGGSIRKFAIIMQACQLGHITPDDVVKWADDQDLSTPITPEQWESMETAVLNELDSFTRV